MRIILKIFGVFLVVVGGTFFLQGINILPGSFMTGDTKWAVIGALLVAIGAWLLFGRGGRSQH